MLDLSYDFIKSNEERQQRCCVHGPTHFTLKTCFLAIKSNVVFLFHSFIGPAVGLIFPQNWWLTKITTIIIIISYLNNHSEILTNFFNLNYNK